jgi:hypothetical protein
MPRREDRDLRVGFTVTKTVTTGTTCIFLLNSAYDPGQAESSRQPIFFDQLKLMYQYYTVKSMDYRITCLYASNLQSWFAFTPNSNNSLPSYLMEDIANYPESKVAFVPSAASSAAPPISISGHVDCVKWLDYSSVDNLCDVNWARTTEDPLNQVYGMLRMSPMDGSTSTNMKFLIEFNLHIRFETPVQVCDALEEKQMPEMEVPLLIEPSPVQNKRAPTPRSVQPLRV